MEYTLLFYSDKFLIYIFCKNIYYEYLRNFLCINTRQTYTVKKITNF